MKTLKKIVDLSAITVEETMTLRGYNWVHFAHRPYCTVILHSNFAILKT